MKLPGGIKKFSSELGHNYGTYTFGYANYCRREKDDKLSDIYAAGYLPYSGSPGVKDIFYMARSARAPLKSFSLTSENRRVARKFDGRLQRQAVKMEDFDIQNSSFLDFCANYFAQRHGPAVMPKERLLTILNSGLITEIVTYKNEGKLTGYVFEVSDSQMTHFWFSFYDLSLVHQSLGMWLLLDSARRAKERKADYFYIGTVYGQKALYKTAFKNLEYWDGEKWIADIKKIKHLGHEDGNRVVGLTDLWKNKQKIFG